MRSVAVLDVDEDQIHEPQTHKRKSAAARVAGAGSLLSEQLEQVWRKMAYYLNQLSASAHRFPSQPAPICPHVTVLAVSQSPCLQPPHLFHLPSPTLLRDVSCFIFTPGGSRNIPGVFNCGPNSVLTVCRGFLGLSG